MGRGPSRTAGPCQGLQNIRRMGDGPTLSCHRHHYPPCRPRSLQAGNENHAVALDKTTPFLKNAIIVIIIVINST